MHSYSRPDVHNSSYQHLELNGEPLITLIKELMSAGRQIRLCARGSSMIPFINDGDLITIVPFLSKKPGLGDVIAFHRVDSNNMVVHRIIRFTRGGYYTKGDNEPDHQDERVPEKNILGLVVRIERIHQLKSCGLGIERVIIALLSRWGWLLPFRRFLAKLRNRF